MGRKKSPTRQARGKGRSGSTHVFASAFDHLIRTSGIQMEDLSRLFCRDARTIDDWRTGKRACPMPFFKLLELTVNAREESDYSRPRYRMEKNHWKTRLHANLRLYFTDVSANDGFTVTEIFTESDPAK